MFVIILIQVFARQIKTSSTHEHIQELGDKAERFEVGIRLGKSLASAVNNYLFNTRVSLKINWLDKDLTCMPLHACKGCSLSHVVNYVGFYQTGQDRQNI